MAELVKLTIDGREVQAEKGALLIEVARQNGIEVPAFCYHEDYSLQAACRMCLVEIEKTYDPRNLFRMNQNIKPA